MLLSCDVCLSLCYAFFLFHFLCGGAVAAERSPLICEGTVLIVFFKDDG